MNENQNIPKLRFEGFTEPWEQHKLGDLAEIKDSARVPNNLWSTSGVPYIRASDVSNDDLQGVLFLFQEVFDFYRKKTGAPVRGDVLFNGGGEIGKSLFINTDQQLYAQGGAVLYARTSESKRLDGVFLSEIFQSRTVKKYIGSTSKGGTMKHFTLEPAKSMPLLIPNDVSEQHDIGFFLRDLDNLVTLYQHKYERLQHLKQALLRKMFPKPGEQVPELRFEGFTEPWEQRKFKDIVTIERGGSPRPIEDFVTDSPNGLNWVKIGDAPSLGRYITRTAEKIRPEGLSKTRQVYPGDLILSNSMSFGRPYIMAIEGCIHDGWLLIRDTTKQLDPIYLCQMLGTPQMFNQYRSLAAGSTVNNLNKELVGNAVVPIPCKEEQKVIGKVLDDLDNLVILHQHKYERLQHLKQALLRKMFI